MDNFPILSCPPRKDIEISGVPNLIIDDKDALYQSSRLRSARPRRQFKNIVHDKASYADWALVDVFERVTVAGGSLPFYWQNLVWARVFPQWQPLTSYGVGAIVRPPGAINDHSYVAIVAGTSGVSPGPVFPTGPMATVTDGSTLVWQEMTAIVRFSDDPPVIYKGDPDNPLICSISYNLREI